MIECKYCGKPFIRTNGKQVYCSKKCCAIVNRIRAIENDRKQREAKPPVIKNCDCCGAEFIYNIHNKRYCSVKCANKMKSSYRRDRKKKNDTPKVKSLAEFQRDAREHGMSYGQYDTYLRLQKGTI